jgi:hypothetical protein
MPWQHVAYPNTPRLARTFPICFPLFEWLRWVPVVVRHGGELRGRAVPRLCPMARVCPMARAIVFSRESDVARDILRLFSPPEVTGTLTSVTWRTTTPSRLFQRVYHRRGDHRETFLFSPPSSSLLSRSELTHSIPFSIHPPLTQHLPPRLRRLRLRLRVGRLARHPRAHLTRASPL